jgi:beta-lactamase regulating signal transducer with metallopeptidase domain
MMPDAIRHLLELLGGRGDQLVHWVLVMNLQLAVVVLIITSVDALVGRRLAARWRLVLYMAAPVRLVLPIGLGLPADTMPMPAVTAMLQPMTGPSVAGVAAASAGDAAATSVSHVGLAAMALYMTVAVAIGARIVRGRWAMARAMRGARPAPMSCVGSRTHACVLVHPTLGPATVGLLRPVIALPADLERRLDAAALQAIVRHERAHIERKDPMLHALLQIIGVVAWPILAWRFAAARVRFLLELAADERSLAGADSTERENHVRALLRSAERLAGRPMQTAALPFVSGIRRRILAARHPAVRWSRPSQLAAIAVSVFAAIGCSLDGTNDNGPTANEPGSAASMILIEARVIETDRLYATTDNALGRIVESDNRHGMISADDTEWLMQRLQSSGSVQMLTSPRMLVESGQAAEMQIGDDVESMRLWCLATLLSDPKDPVRIDVTFEREISGERTAFGEVGGMDIGAGQTLVLVPGPVDGERSLIVLVMATPTE